VADGIVRTATLADVTGWIIRATALAGFGGTISAAVNLTVCLAVCAAIFLTDVASRIVCTLTGENRCCQRYSERCQRKACDFHGFGHCLSPSWRPWGT
jgi:hypothetical protein